MPSRLITALSSYIIVVLVDFVCCLDLITSKGIATDQYRAPEAAPMIARVVRLVSEVMELYISRKPKKAALPTPHLKHVAAMPLFKFLIDFVKCDVLVCD